VHIATNATAIAANIQNNGFFTILILK
jgi:hypothetical protein